MRLIDAEELEQSTYEMFVHAKTPGKQFVAKTIKDMIDNAPTIDAVQVVRCKDCRFNEESEWNVICTKDMYRSRGCSWFCADGELKET